MSDSLIVEDERTYNWTSECNNCHKPIYWNWQVRHKKTRRCLPMNNEYHSGVVPKRHQCMLHGTRAGYINKYEDNTPKPVLDVDKVDKRTLEIEHKRWLETIGYQPLNEWELEQVELGRKYYKTFQVDKKK